MIDSLQSLKVALVHYWLVNRRGGEAVLEGIGRLLPHADLITHVADRATLFGSLVGMPLRTTFIAKLPAAKKIYQAYLPLMPLALEAIDVGAYDLIISSEAGPAKWIIPSPTAKHICYCHSPMRYLWDQRLTYYDAVPWFARPLAHLAGNRLRQSDVLSSFRVSQFVANSSFVAKRIEQYYRRDAEVIFPPVDVEEFESETPEDFYLCAGAIRHYKRLDLAVQACEALGRRLVIAGGGNNSKLKALAGKHVEFMGHVDFDTMRSLLRRCRALIFPGVEDFGIVPVEAMASGRPVIAFKQGGALDSIEPGISGIFFDRQTVDHLCDAIREFERHETSLTTERCQQSAARFSRAVFEERMTDLILRVVSGRA